MPVIFELKPNTRHAAKQRRGFLRLLASGVNNKLKFIYSAVKPRGVLAEVLAVKVSARPNRCRGFTLLELLVVIGLLGLVAMSITSLVVEDQGVKRQEVTEKRWDEIRKAIVGDTSRTLNGEPMLSGYVADMGRLPASLKELMVRGDQPEWASVALSGVTNGATGELSGGWRGPYLYTGGSQFFRDGWSNVDPDNIEDNKNFGWVVGLSGTSPNITDMTVQSFGFNNAAGGEGYDEDSPSVATIANANGWQLNSSNVTFNVVFNKPPTLADQTNLKLMVYFFEDDATVNLPTDSIQPEPSSTFSHVKASATPHTESVSINGPLPMGKLAVVVLCTQGTPLIATDDKVYDGNCSSPTNTKQPYYYTLLPSTVPSITIPWNIP